MSTSTDERKVKRAGVFGLVGWLLFRLIAADPLPSASHIFRDGVKGYLSRETSSVMKRLLSVRVAFYSAGLLCAAIGTLSILVLTHDVVLCLQWTWWVVSTTFVVITVLAVAAAVTRLRSGQEVVEEAFFELYMHAGHFFLLLCVLLLAFGAFLLNI